LKSIVLSFILFLLSSVVAGSDHSVIRVQNSRLIDTGGGFLIEEKALEEEQSKEVVKFN